jgi:hypothetical protein
MRESEPDTVTATAETRYGVSGRRELSPTTARVCGDTRMLEAELDVDLFLADKRLLMDRLACNPRSIFRAKRFTPNPL